MLSCVRLRRSRIPQIDSLREKLEADQRSHADLINTSALTTPRCMSRTYARQFLATTPIRAKVAKKEVSVA